MWPVTTMQRLSSPTKGHSSIGHNKAEPFCSNFAACHSRAGGSPPMKSASSALIPSP